MKNVFTKYTNDEVIATCAFGISVDSQRSPWEKKNEFYMFSREVTDISALAILKVYIFTNLPWLARLINLKLARPEMQVSSEIS